MVKKKAFFNNLVPQKYTLNYYYLRRFSRFPKIKIVKRYLRSIMKQNRFCVIFFFSIERGVDFEELTDEFAGARKKECWWNWSDVILNILNFVIALSIEKRV